MKISNFKFQISNSPGFTLIEILVVATIIGLLAAGGFASYSAFLKQSRDARRATDLEQIRAALEQYKSNVGTYPTTITVGSPIADTNGNTYLSKVPDDPMPSKYSYSLTVDPSGKDYTICSYFEARSGAASTGSDSVGAGAGVGAGSGPGPIPSIGGTCGDQNCNYCLGPYGEKTP